MPSTYELRVYSAAGVLKSRITDFGALSCIRAVNKPGLLSTVLRGDHPAIAFLEHKSHVELWCSDLENGIDPYRYFGGLYLKQKRKTAEEPFFTLSAPGYLWFLTTRINAWYADTASRSKFTSAKGETVMKTLVSYNACSNATVVNGRYRAGAITGLSIQADGTNGNTIDWACANKPLLENLQELALVAGGDFDLVKTGTNTFEFRWYTGQLGTDRTASLTFSMGKANMATPIFEYDRISEKTVAIVGGQGIEDNRTIVIRTGTDYSASNDTEIFVSATNVNTTGAYNTAGDKKLKETQAFPSFNFKILQTPSCLFGRDYFLGDKCKAIDAYNNTEYTVKITEANLNREEDGTQSIDLTVESV